MAQKDWTLAPHLMVSDAKAAIEFYKNAFGAEVRFRQETPDHTHVVHAELDIHGNPVMLGDASLGGGAKSGTVLHLGVPDVDAVFKHAAEAGATVTMAVEDMFWGDRYGKLTDPFGQEWSMSTHVRDVSQAEMDEAVKRWFGGAAS